jgi:hypothetical protein
VSPFRDSHHAAEIIGGFFRQEAAEDDKIFAGSGLVVGYDIRDPDVRVVLDAREKPRPGFGYGVYINDVNAPPPHVEFTLDAENFDKLYRGEVQAMTLMMTGKGKARGDITAAMRLLPAMARSIPHYKAYREAH